MPEFKRSFEHTSFIIPVFMRTLAIAFLQAGLISSDHPALSYGAPGIRKYGFMNLMGDAWIKLRTTKAQPYQWGIFGAVVAMVFTILVNIASIFINLAFGLGSAARAQIFAVPGVDTSTIPDGTGGTTMVDMQIRHPDVAIDMLDKFIRQGSENLGGPMQNAMQALMGVYATGMLVIAAVMVFWMILSVVVDTAAKGTIGGGRHNMVWTPIRVVFALGLMIPLGNFGFTSGQYMVMKLAEWGSNLGTNGWVAYVNSLAGQSMISQPPPLLKGQMMVDYARIQTCRIAYNAYQLQSAAPSANHRIDPIVSFVGENNASILITYENATGNAVCGTVKMANPDEGAPAGAAVMAANSGGSVLNPIGFRDDLVSVEQELRRGYVQAFFNAPVAGPAPAGPMTESAADLGCDMTHVVFGVAPGGGPIPEVDTACGVAGGARGACGPYVAVGAGAGPSNPSADTCIQNMITQFDAAYAPFLANARNAAVAAEGILINQVRDAGWAAMGVWFNRVTQLNLASQEAAKNKVVITAGIFKPTTAIGDSMDGKMGGGAALVRGVANLFASHSEQEQKTIEALENYDSWWRIMQDNNSTDPEFRFSEAVNGTKDLGGGSTIMDAFSALIPGFISDWFESTFTLGTGTNETYQITRLAEIGNSIVNVALGLLGAAIVVGIGSDAAASAISTIGLFIMVAGGVLLYYIPLLPWVRVFFSVMTWALSVFEAVVMIPLVALTFLTTQGEGLGGQRSTWVLWLNILTRPILTVIGFTGALVLFSVLVSHINDTFATAVLSTTGGKTPSVWASFAYILIYASTIYTLVNSCFKLVDVIPQAAMKWLGGPQDTTFNESAMEGLVMSGTQTILKAGGGIGNIGKALRGGAKGGSVPSVSS